VRHELILGFSFTSNDEARQVLDKVLSTAGFLPQRFEIKAADVDNALACEDHGSSIRYILFNPSWIRGLTAGASNNEYWTRVGILAHEVGHHALNHYLEGDESNPRFELEADEFAGAIMAKMGATVRQAQSAFGLPGMCSQEGGGDHPKCADRIAAVAKGWHTFYDNLAPGTPIPSHPHVIACQEKGKWCPDAGYAFVRRDPNFTARWLPGKKHPSAAHVIAGDKEGAWSTEPGYSFANNVPNDLTVRWQPGKAIASHPHVVACKEEGKLCTEPGYVWVNQSNPWANNLDVKPAP